MECATSIASVKHAGGRCVNYLSRNALLVPLHFGRRAMVQQILDIGVGLGASLEQGALWCASTVLAIDTAAHAVSLLHPPASQTLSMSLYISNIWYWVICMIPNPIGL